ncbi:hypothetical protein MTO96_014180 [Rhipicephalus appendiculatus]
MEARAPAIVTAALPKRNATTECAAFGLRVQDQRAQEVEEGRGISERAHKNSSSLIVCPDASTAASANATCVSSVVYCRILSAEGGFRQGAF